MTDTARQSQATRGAIALELEAESLAAPLPPLLVEAERLSAIVGLGVHGRRKAGMGETFWQFRRYAPGDASNTVDWRQSAKSQHLFVREREWEAVEAVWFWRDGTASMRFSSDGNTPTKFDRANLLALALACLLVRGGEYVAALGGAPPAGGRGALHRLAHRFAADETGNGALPPSALFVKTAQLVWFSDFLSPLSDIDGAVRKLASAGFAGHLVHLIDPAEQDFPYTGRTRFEWGRAGQGELLGRAESASAEYRRRFEAQRQGVRELAGTAGWTYFAHRTDGRPEMALVALFADLGGMTAHRAMGVR
ncbi:MAG: DUF58 domain-containing protein [Rhizomicrobium sp.]